MQQAVVEQVSGSTVVAVACPCCRAGHDHSVGAAGVQLNVEAGVEREVHGVGGDVGSRDQLASGVEGM